ncbi:hypothetical protein B0H17DRAFT_1198872 [Mycena rosella]|uniref:Uncharacterized protein n=1 Tax=Mycena rosella TaxID=1033263 RepID=A0AAD7DPM9_MYCRO|nr:hypothetical protein B0H17DRAFT_1198872 [Mycena rosella]
MRRKISTSRWLIPFLFVSYIFLFRTPEQAPAEAEQSQLPAQLPSPQLTFNFSSLVLEIGKAHFVERGSLTAILPVTQASLLALPDTLSPFLGPSSCVSKVLVVCPESLLLRSRAAVRQVFRSAPENVNHPDVSLHPWGGDGSPTVVALQVAAHASTKWLLILDDTGLNGLSDRTRDMLLCPVAVELPTGPRGVVGAPGNRSCAPPSPEALPALYLLPPFTLPSTLIQNVHEDWFNFGRSISQARKDRLGGVIRGYGDPDANWRNSVCPNRLSTTTSPRGGTKIPTPFVGDRSGGLFIFLLPNIDDLHLALQLLCRLYETGHSIKILLYANSRPASGVWETSSSCPLQYDAIVDQRTELGIHDWLGRMEREPDIIFAVSELATRSVTNEHSIVVRIPPEDLRHAHWMGSLSLTEWKNWNVPRIDISIITQDRPQSLARLLSSLSQGRFFGDSLSLRLNMEQSSDLETIRMVGAYQWGHGAVFTHRRVIHGGLLPAVVESWYPHSNDSYGLLLEDDVELSPLFYAWIKMGILRYRYGEGRSPAAQLFGISLYQQKNIELHPEGRKAFDPRRLFAKNNVPDPSTPYLSQIPCSWGAVYFPEHWREFHDYLAARLSESTMEIERIVVPDVRSNNWTKSWKKYFIEMVYLRGYVMLYPNYAEFVSLSTNHLEVGSHVKERPKEKQEVFRLPLMELSESRQLLDLPGGGLPGWETLPVLNLTGCMSSLEEIIRAGEGN